MGDSFNFPRRRWLPEVHRWLIERLQEPGLLCLDWDETCAAGDIGEALVRHLDEDGTAWRRYQDDLEKGEVLKAYVESCFVLAGLSETEVKRQCEQAVEAALASGAVQVRPEMQDLMALARELGWEVWVVSASVTPVVEAFSARYGQDAHQVIGMDLVVEKGTYQPRLLGPATYRKGKVDAILERVGRAPDLAAGDTLTDLEMLESARHGLVIGPRHEELRRLAVTRGWAIQPEFERS